MPGPRDPQEDRREAVDRDDAGAHAGGLPLVEQRGDAGMERIEYKAPAPRGVFRRKVEIAGDRRLLR